jgi:hypothetical protein
MGELNTPRRVQKHPHNCKGINETQPQTTGSIQELMVLITSSRPGRVRADMPHETNAAPDTDTTAAT